MTAPVPDEQRAGAAVRQVMAEIHDEVRRRRALGDLPADLEHELDAVFARFAPAGAAEEEFTDLLDKVERAAFIDGAAPIASNLPGGQAVKGALRRATGFAIQHLAVQISAFDHAVARALRRLDERLRAVEDASAMGPTWDLAVAPGRPDLVSWTGLIVERLQGGGAAGSGRVLHADAGDGSLVARLRGAGFDSYGAESERGWAGRAPAGIEVREAGALEHLAMLADHVLAGAVLSGCTDALPRDGKLALAGQAARALRPGAPVVLIGTAPAAWDAVTSPVQRDLGDGRPFDPATWAHVLAAGPFTTPDVVAADDGPAYAVVASRQ